MLAINKIQEVNYDKIDGQLPFLKLATNLILFTRDGFNYLSTPDEKPLRVGEYLTRENAVGPHKTFWGLNCYEFLGDNKWLFWISKIAFIVYDLDTRGGELFALFHEYEHLDQKIKYCNGYCVSQCSKGVQICRPVTFKDVGEKSPESSDSEQSTEDNQSEDKCALDEKSSREITIPAFSEIPVVQFRDVLRYSPDETVDRAPIVFCVLDAKFETAAEDWFILSQTSESKIDSVLIVNHLGKIEFTFDDRIFVHYDDDKEILTVRNDKIFGYYQLRTLTEETGEEIEIEKLLIKLTNHSSKNITMEELDKKFQTNLGILEELENITISSFHGFDEIIEAKKAKIAEIADE